MGWLLDWLWPPPPAGAAVSRADCVEDVETMLKTHHMRGGDGRDYHLIYTDAKTGGRVYLGGVDGLENRALMRHIGAVVSVVDDRFPLAYVEQFVDPDQGLFYASVDDASGENIARYFNPTYRFIEKHLRKGLDVYIHCVAGMSRSSTIAANWLMRRHGMSPKEALHRLKSKRRIVRPNPGFVKQLCHRSQ